MTAARRPLKARLRSGERLLGVLLRLPNESLVELAGHSGFDVVVLDCEHGPVDGVALQHHVAAAESVGLEVLVRTGGADPGEVLRVLDLGVAGIVVPHVRDAGAARAAVAAAHYPPLGSRGFASYTRAGRYGVVPAAEHLRRTAERTVVVVMVEDADGVANAGGSLAVEGVDAVLVGPADLAVSLGVLDGPDDAEVRRATAHVHAEAGRRGRSVVVVVGSRPAAAAAFDDGAHLVVYNTQSVLTGVFAELQSARPGAGAT